MASNTLPASSEKAVSSDGLTPTDIATAIIAPLASLKLTVFLLFTAIAVVFIATLQQASMDMWSVKNMHYDNWFVTIPFQWLLIERWFPDYQNVPGSFTIPSGKPDHLCADHKFGRGSRASISNQGSRRKARTWRRDCPRRCRRHLGNVVQHIRSRWIPKGALQSAIRKCG